MNRATNGCQTCVHMCILTPPALLFCEDSLLLSITLSLLYLPTLDMEFTLPAGEGVSDFSPLALTTLEGGSVAARSARGLVCFSKIFGFSTSSLLKLDFSRRVLSATEGGFSGRGGAGPLLPPWELFTLDIFFPSKHKCVWSNTSPYNGCGFESEKILHK